MNTLYFKILLLILLLLSHKCSRSQTQVYIGTDSTYNDANSFPCPYGNGWVGTRHQILIKASELYNAGGGPGNIYAIAFEINWVNGVSLKNFSIKMKNTTVNNLVSLFDTSGLIMVYDNQEFFPTIGWSSHNFTNPFFWDGNSNILIETCFENEGANGTNIRMNYTGTNFNSVNYFASIANEIETCKIPSGTLSMKRPNLKIFMQPNNSPPLIDYNIYSSFSCSGSVRFNDISINNPVSWLWNFGDGLFSTLQNPIHNYTFIGDSVYNISLKACNSNSCDSLQKTFHLIVDTNIPLLAGNCYPPTTNYCCGYGINKVELGSINNASDDAAIGYEDFSCIGTTLIAGNKYAIKIETGPNEPQNTRVWIDFNNDQVLDNNTELVFSDNNSYNPWGNVFIPENAITSTSLKMRISSDDAGTSPLPCNDLSSGQAEDYTIYILPNIYPPKANFLISDSLPCDGRISFNDISDNIPTTYLWNFGDGSFDSVKNPTHSYSSPGYQSVKLTVCNNFGCDSITKQNIVNIQTFKDGPVASVCTPSIINSDSVFGIFEVFFEAIYSITPGGEEYKDYSCFVSTNLNAGLTYDIYIKTHFSDMSLAVVWIDFNNNGNFNNSEIVFLSFNTPDLHEGEITIPLNAVKETPLRMRIAAGLDSWWWNNINYCGYFSGEAEDYSVIIHAPVQNSEMPKTEHLMIFPTISDGNIQVDYSFNNEREINLFIYDVVGKCLFQEKTFSYLQYKKLFNLNNYGKGIYLLKIADGKQIIIRKIVLE